MNKISFAIAVLCGLTHAAELKLPSITYDEKAVGSALSQWNDMVGKTEPLAQASFQQDWIDVNHIFATARA